MARYYRFCLRYEEDDEELGFLTGLTEVGMDDDEFYPLMGPFDKLLDRPPLNDPCTFYFTEAGLQKLLPFIAAIQLAVMSRRWTLVVYQMEVPAEEAEQRSIYQDEDQIAFRPDDPLLTGIGAAKDFMEFVEPWVAA